ncbi:TPA: hypothetical protein ACOVJJ_005475 [Klebsiella oxytoca]
MHKYLSLLLLAFLVVGCSTTGEDKFSSSYVKAHIVPHKTTQAEVQAIYGTPDDQFMNSDGTVSWTYDRSGNLSTASSIASYIPGASAVSSALGMAETASSASSAATKASGKISGDTEYHARSLNITFDNNKIVNRWYM